MSITTDFQAPQSLDVSAIRGHWGVNRKIFSRLTGYSERSIAEWEKGKSLTASSRTKMGEVDRLRRALAGVMDADSIATWIETPNEGFDGLKPLEVIERGEVDRIWRMVFYLESGVSS